MDTTPEREEFLEEMERRVERLQEDLKGLGEQLGKSPEAVQAEYEETRQSLTEKQEQVLRDIREAKAKGTGAWAEMKVGLENAWKELDGAAERARTKFRSR